MSTPLLTEYRNMYTRMACHIVIQHIKDQGQEALKLKAHLAPRRLLGKIQRREHGFGKFNEVYSHFIKMESKRLEEKRNAEGESGAKVFQEKTASEEKIADMV